MQSKVHANLKVGTKGCRFLFCAQANDPEFVHVACYGRITSPGRSMQKQLRRAGVSLNRLVSCSLSSCSARVPVISLPCKDWGLRSRYRAKDGTGWTAATLEHVSAVPK